MRLDLEVVAFLLSFNVVPSRSVSLSNAFASDIPSMSLGDRIPLGSYVSVYVDMKSAYNKLVLHTWIEEGGSYMMPRLVFDTGSDISAIGRAYVPSLPAALTGRETITFGIQDQIVEMHIEGWATAPTTLQFTDGSRYHHISRFAIFDKLDGVTSIEQGIIGASASSSFNSLKFAFIPFGSFWLTQRRLSSTFRLAGHLSIGLEERVVEEFACSSPFVFFSNIDKTYWKIDGSVSVADVPVDTLPWIIDTGAPWIYIPEDQFTELLSRLGRLSECVISPISDTLWLSSECVSKEMMMTFQFGSGFTLSLSVIELSIFDSTRGKYMLEVAPMKQVAILGMPFLKSVGTFFDSERVGFCLLNRGQRSQ